MKLNTLKPAKGSIHKQKRLGRGEASGKGGTSTQGNKGGQSRAGHSYKWGHEGGQMPIQRRLPKRGFVNTLRTEYKIFNLGQIDELVKSYNLDSFSLENLYLNKLINRTDKVKILGKGVLTNKIDFKVNAISTKSKETLEKIGCKIELVN